MSELVKLEWKGAFSLAETTIPVASFPGVYIWGFKLAGKPIPYYVGQSKNVIGRIQVHLRSLLSGFYTVYHKDSLSRFVEFKDDDVNKDFLEDIIKGKVFIPDSKSGKDSFYFINNREKIQPHIDFMLEHFVFSYAEVKLEDYEAHGKRISDLTSKTKPEKTVDFNGFRKHIEAECIKCFGLVNLSNTNPGTVGCVELTHKPLLSDIWLLKEKPV